MLHLRLIRGLRLRFYKIQPFQRILIATSILRIPSQNKMDSAKKGHSPPIIKGIKQQMYGQESEALLRKRHKNKNKESKFSLGF